MKGCRTPFEPPRVLKYLWDAVCEDIAGIICAKRPFGWVATNANNILFYPGPRPSRADDPILVRYFDKAQIDLKF